MIFLITSYKLFVLLTVGIDGMALEDDSIVGEEERALGRQTKTAR